MRGTMQSLDKLRILAIHGYAQSDEIFKSKLGALRKCFKKELDFTFVKAPFKVPKHKGSNGLDIETNGFGWWFNTEDRTFRATEPSDLSVGFQESLNVIETAFKEFGPFDGILGFSQGAAFTVILCAMQEKNLLRVKFDFCIIISGFKSLCAPHAIYYTERINIPSLHVYGETDQVIAMELAKDVTELFVNKKIVIHEGGHYVPGKKVIYQDFVNEMLELKYGNS